jgi:hypothetical protein
VSEEGETPEPDWAEIIRQARYVQQHAPDTMRRLVEAARVAHAHLGPTLAAGQELARAMDAGIREVMETMRGFGGEPPLPTASALLATATPAVHDSGVGVDMLTVVRTTATLSLKKITFAGEGQVISDDKPNELKRKLPGLTPGLIYAVLVVLLLVGDLSLIEMRLSPEAQQFMTDAEGIAALLAPFSVWWWRQNHKDGDDRDR